MTSNADTGALRLQYSVRCAFFYRQRKQWQALLSAIAKLDSQSYNWSDLAALGITPSAWSHVQKRAIAPCRVFCYPDVITSAPFLVDYYLSVCGLPKKGKQQLTSIARRSAGRAGSGNASSRALAISQQFNSYMSSLIDADPKFRVDDVLLLGAMNFGTQVNGSWRNEIGAAGDRRVKELIATYFLDAQLVTKLKGKGETDLGLESWGPIANLQSIVLVNGFAITFGSDPDVSLRSPEGVLEAAIEVKAGLDRAGALERYGAAKKSFDRALQENKASSTIYLASCITEGVRKAIANDRLVRREFDLSEVFINPKAREEFLTYLRWLAHL